MSRTLVTVIIVVIVVIIAAGFFYAINGGSSSLATNNIASTTGFGDLASTTASATSSNSLSRASSTVVLTPRTSRTPGAPATGGTSGTVTKTPSPTPKKTATLRPTSTRTPSPTATRTPTPTPTQPQANINPQANPYPYIFISSNPASSVVTQQGSTNIPVMHFIVQAPPNEGATVNQLIMGSDQNNSFFNYLENFKVMRTSDGAYVGSLDYMNRLVNYHPVFSISNPINQNSGSSVDYTVIADLKPGVSRVNIPALMIFGGTGNIMVAGNAEGGMIIVQ